jgi:uncharacterized repeat protein (TIGR03803 family)
MPRLFAGKFQALNVVVPFVATFCVLAAFTAPAAAQNSVPLTTRPWLPHTNAPRVPGFTLTANGARFVPASSENWNENVLHSFGSGNEASFPYAGLIRDAAGNLYGTAPGLSGGGGVFELSPNQHGGWTETVLYNFCSQSNCTDGAYPYAGLILDAAGNLYGTTYEGGAVDCNNGPYAPGCGTVFELSPTAGGGWTETVLYSFCSQSGCADGSYPYASLIFDAAGNLYGTTSNGGTNYCNGPYGSNCGTVFKLSPTVGGGWTETVLHNFIDDGTDGWGSQAGLILDAAGNLYGTTTYGGNNGNGCGEYGCGTVFEVSPTVGGGWTETVLYAFPNYAGTDGYMPFASLIMDADGNLYGTTVAGGSYYEDQGGGGTAFELSPTGDGGWTETKLYSFGNGLDAVGPYAGLIFDAAGNLYGTACCAGTNYNGGVFELSPTVGGWTETVLYNFCSENGCIDGGTPLGSLIFDAAGNLYGTTQDGGTYTYGTAFELTPQAQLTIVNFDFGAVPVTCSNGYAYQGATTSCSSDFPTQNFDQSPGFGWIIGGPAAHSIGPEGDAVGGAGLTGPGTSLSPPPFTGLPFTQAAFLQSIGAFVRQPVNFAAGSYTLSFYLGSRYEGPPHDGNQTVEALIDGNVVGTWALPSFTPFTLQTASFTVTNSGIHTLEFMGVAQGDHTAFLSYVTITPTDRHGR